MAMVVSSVAEPKPEVRRRNANAATVAIRSIAAVATIGRCGVAVPDVALLDDSVPVSRRGISTGLLKSSL